MNKVFPIKIIRTRFEVAYSIRIALWLSLFIIATTIVPRAEASFTHEITVTNHVTIKPGSKWSPKFWMGNQDEPVPPDDYRPNDKHRVSRWYYRNPTHNLNYYVIGVADKTFRRSGRYPHEVFNPKGGWNWTVCKYKWWRLPFISYQKKSFCVYLGWRERGNFGGKLSFHGGN